MGAEINYPAEAARSSIASILTDETPETICYAYNAWYCVTNIITNLKNYSTDADANEKRTEIMPVNRKWNIAALLSACVSYYAKTGRRISFEYTLISGKNDSEADARALGELLIGAFRKSGAPLHVNLIRVNEVRETGFKRGSRESVEKFAKILENMGVTATVRRKLGSDIEAACGQLRRSKMAEIANN